jgi:D-glycerate 3-kinase
MTVQLDLSGFIHNHALPEGYALTAQKWFVPVAERIKACRDRVSRPVVVGINGSQGSGKSTLADLLVHVLGQACDIHALALSIDDFYLTREEREALARKVHPLLATRGVPGTHDMNLALQTLSGLREWNGPVAIPRFDKARDDRYPEAQWDVVNRRVDVIILEGWCLGSDAQPEHELITPINSLESDEDPQGTWRNHVNRQLQQDYPELFSRVDAWIMLKAPSFECIFDWRLEQEQKLCRALEQQGRDSLAAGVMSRDDIACFIQHYQRITEHTLSSLPDKVHFLFELDENREIIRLSYPVELEC